MEILDNNNLDLQKLMQEIQALPQAKSWGGSTTIEADKMQNPVKIPAYTDKEITVNPPTTKSATGTVTFSDTYSNVEVNIPHNLNKKLKSFVMLTSTTNHAATYSAFAYPYFYSDTDIYIMA